MSRASKSSQDYKQSNTSKLLDRLKERRPELFPLTGVRFHHEPLCESQRRFCDCDCAVTISLPDGRTFS